VSNEQFLIGADFPPLPSTLVLNSKLDIVIHESLFHWYSKESDFLALKSTDKMSGYISEASVFGNP
jgi:hypothetical protein